MTLVFYLLIFFVSFCVPVLLADNKNRLAAPVRRGLHKIPYKRMREVAAVLLMIFPVWFVLTFRYGVGSDYFTYETMFRDYVYGGYVNDEVGLIALFSFSNFWGLGYRGFLFFSAFLSLFIMAWALRDITNPQEYAVAYLLYLCLYFGPMCNIVAQTIAVPIMFVAYRMIQRKRPVEYVILCVVASMLHMTALLLIPLYWIYHYVYQKHPVYCAAVILIVGALFAVAPGVLRIFMNNPLLKKYMGYLTQERIGTWWYMLVYRFPLYVVELVCMTELIYQEKTNRFGYFLLVLEIASLLLGIGISWGGRFCYYFSVAHIILACQIIKYYRRMLFPRLIRQGLVLYFVVAFAFMHFHSEFDRIMSYQFRFGG